MKAEGREGNAGEKIPHPAACYLVCVVTGGGRQAATEGRPDLCQS